MMTISMSIVEGFQKEIQQKISGFGAHISVHKYESRGLTESSPLSRNRESLQDIANLEGVEHLQSFIYKGAVLKTEDENQAVLVKGVGDDFQWDFFEKSLKIGKLADFSQEKRSDEVILSKNLAQKIGLEVGDDFLLYFIQQPPRFRKFKIVGLYNTGLGEMDEKVLLIDLRHLQKINGWNDDQIGGIEILLKDFDQIEAMTDRVDDHIDYDLSATSIVESRVDIFNWLELQDVNVIVIISLLVLVCGIDIISALLILILERTQLIGILKAMGSSNKSIQKIFIYNAAYLIIAGLIIGNVIGLGLCWLQLKFGLLGLPQEAYFIDKVPIRIVPIKLIILNLGTLFICLLMLLLPSRIVAGIEPSKSIRFD